MQRFTLLDALGGVRRRLMSELGHRSLAVLKIDIEGAEQRVLEDLLDSNLREVSLLRSWS
jgi:hypothetical protein